MKNEQDDLSQSLETKEQFKTKFTENESQDIKISKSEKKKKKKRENLYAKEEDIKKNKLSEKSAENYIHNLFISNENQRTKQLIF